MTHLTLSDFPLTPKDYPEDFDGENGRYMCKCCECGSMFQGNKHRQVCKECFGEGE